MSWSPEIHIGPARVALDAPTFFIADIAANHDGDLGRAKDLIWRAKEAGADCAKFQHFLAGRIVSGVGFSQLGAQQAHQSAWKKSVVEVYDQYHTRRDWTDALVETCQAADIAYMTTPYELEAVETQGPLVPAFKIGSGDITFFDLIDACTALGKPVLLATGAATMADVEASVARITARTPDIVLMQCNTNYTGSKENFGYINLRTLTTFAAKWPDMLLGLSDHTPGHAAVLGAVTLGARVVEKHFTDDNHREGPDHGFAMNPRTWRDMVEATRELEAALGDGIKRIEGNEAQTVVVQRRALRLKADRPAGYVLSTDDIEALRPCPAVREAARHGAVFVVDDRSTDGSPDLARREGATVLAAAAPGYDGALTTGLRHAFDKGFARLVTLDADGEHDPALVKTFGERLKSAPLVCGIRPKPQRLAEHVVGWAALGRYGLHDILCGMKGYGRPVIEAWIASGAPLNVNMTPAIRWRAAGGAFDEVKVSGTPRPGNPRFGRALAANRAILSAYVRAVSAA